MKPALLLSSVALFCCASSTLADNLLQNPGAEDTEGSDLLNWEEVDADFFHEQTTPPANSGRASFRVLGNHASLATVTLEQSFEVGSEAAAIDAGEKWARLGGFIRTVSNAQDACRLQAEFFDGGGSTLGMIDTGFLHSELTNLVSANPLAWAEVIEDAPVPPGTREVTFRLMFQQAKFQLTTIDAFADDLSFELFDGRPPLDNLLKNGSFEYFAGSSVDADFVGWTKVGDTNFRLFRRSGIEKPDGLGFVELRDVEQGMLYQEVDVSHLDEIISSNRAWATFSGAYSSQLANQHTQIRLVFLDGDDNETASFYSPKNSSTMWMPHQVIRKLPDDTQTVRVELLAEHDSEQTLLGAFFDNMRLSISEGLLPDSNLINDGGLDQYTHLAWTNVSGTLGVGSGLPDPYEGTGYFRSHSQGPNPPPTIAEQEIDLSPFSDVVVPFYVFADFYGAIGNNGVGQDLCQIEVEFRDGSDQVIGDKFDTGSVYPGYYTWQPVSGTVRVPPGALKAVVRLTGHRVQSQSTIGAIFDSLSLTIREQKVYPAQPIARSSSRYQIKHEAILSSVTLKSSSANYMLDSAIEVPGSGGSSGTIVAARTGFIGQLSDVVGLNFLPGTTAADEGSGLPYQLFSTNDDGTQTELVVNQDLTIDPVFQNESVDYSVTFEGVTSPTEPIFVSNFETDNFGTVANDGIDDAWQFAHFDQNNDRIIDNVATAAPDADPDGDGDNNRFESLTNTSPTDGDDFLTRTLTRPAPGRSTLLLTEVLPGARYTLRSSLDLQSWHQVDQITPVAISSATLLDLSTGPSRSFHILALDRVRSDVARFRFASDAMGWTAGGGAAIAQPVVEHLGIIDSTSGRGFVEAPTHILGDLQSYDGGSFTFEITELVTGLGNPYRLGDLELHGFTQGGSPIAVTLEVQTTNGSEHTIPITRPAAITQADWNALIADVDSIRLYLDPTESHDDQISIGEIALFPAP